MLCGLGKPGFLHHSSVLTGNVATVGECTRLAHASLHPRGTRMPDFVFCTWGVNTLDEETKECAGTRFFTGFRECDPANGGCTTEPAS